jgi:hypothetical protein
MSLSVGRLGTENFVKDASRRLTAHFVISLPRGELVAFEEKQT